MNTFKNDFLETTDLSDSAKNHIKTLVLAGGGNRCWWQAGALSCLLEKGWRIPETLVGTSAGAAIATSCITHSPEHALNACIKLYAQNEKMFQWADLIRGKLKFAHQWVYPSWVSSFVNSESFNLLKKSDTSVIVAVSRPSVPMGLRMSVLMGTLAYIVDKKISHSIHPRLPKFLGLRQEFMELNQCDNFGDAHKILCASAAPPPIMKALLLSGEYAFDGGYTDNAPIPEQNNSEKSKTLVMLTRYYENKAAFFNHAGRLYWQPSRSVPVSTWDCTAKATVRDAFQLGYVDALGAIQSGMIRI